METETRAYTVRTFCAAYNIGHAKLYELWAAGEGPATFNVGRRRLIRREAAEKWAAGLERAQAGTKSAAR